jgi:hypothetical protein
MEEGFVQDTSQHEVRVERWIEGQPEKSFWRGVKTKDKRQFDVTTWRCSRCGYLEAYAR